MKRFLFFLSFVLTVKINIWISSLFIFLLWFVFIKAFVFEESIKPKDNEKNSLESDSHNEEIDSDFGKSQNQIDTAVPAAGCFHYLLFPLTGGYWLGFILKAYHSPGWEWIKELFSVNPMG